MKAKHITRKEKRNKHEESKINRELTKVINHFFPELIQLLGATKDPRNPHYITYKNDTILFIRLLGIICNISSMRKLTESFNTNVFIANVKTILGLPKLEELPHWSTINNYHERVNPEEIASIIPQLLKRLLRMRSFESSRIRDKYWQIAIDGTGLYHFAEKHCEHCLYKVHRNPDGSVKNIEYYHYVVEAKLIIGENIAISIATEFVENEDSTVSKQDCELKATYRLIDELKGLFKRLPICLTFDSLYVSEPILNKCRANNWAYIMRYKDGSAPTIGQEFRALQALEPHKTTLTTADGVVHEYQYANEIDYRGHMVNMISEKASDMAYPFVFITNLPINDHNQFALVHSGRMRWKIENEGFNRQKNHGYALQHLYSHNNNAMKNHYYLIQIGHMISQLLEQGVKLWRETKCALYSIHEKILTSLTMIVFTEEEFMKAKKATQIRFA